MCPFLKPTQVLSQKIPLPPPPYFFIFCFYAQFRLGQVKVMFGAQGQERGLGRAPLGQSPAPHPQGLELEKKTKNQK